MWPIIVAVGGPIWAAVAISGIPMSRTIKNKRTKRKIINKKKEKMKNLLARDQIVPTSDLC